VFCVGGYPAWTLRFAFVGRVFCRNKAGSKLGDDLRANAQLTYYSINLDR